MKGPCVVRADEWEELSCHGKINPSSFLQALELIFNKTERKKTQCVNIQEDLIHVGSKQTLEAEKTKLTSLLHPLRCTRGKSVLGKNVYVCVYVCLHKVTYPCSGRWYKNYICG